MWEPWLPEPVLVSRLREKAGVTASATRTTGAEKAGVTADAASAARANVEEACVTRADVENARIAAADIVKAAIVEAGIGVSAVEKACVDFGGEKEAAVGWAAVDGGRVDFGWGEEPGVSVSAHGDLQTAFEGLTCPFVAEKERTVVRKLTRRPQPEISFRVLAYGFARVPKAAFARC